jgi:hypothetical protein
VTGERLADLAAQWNRRWLGGALAAAAAAGITAGVAAARIGGLGPMTGAGVAAIAGLIVLGAALLRRTRLDARLVARHLDRTIPDVEESAELALADETRLSPLERLQRHRVLERLERVPEPALPHRPLRRALRVAAALLAAAATIALWPAAGRSSGPSGGTAAARGDGPESPPRVTAVDVGITPPGYTGRRPRRARDWDLDGVEAGARITWRIDVSGPVTAGALVTTAGDSVPLRPAGAGRLSAALAPDGPRLYQVTVVGPGGRAVTGYHRLVVVPDAAPVVTVVRPDLRTTLHPATAARVDLEVLASDDYGLAGADIVATLTSGQGEAVKFREQRLAFERREQRPGGGWLLRRTLDLRALGLGPGDELYFYVTARDGRRPEPNEARSETHFITISDTARAVSADFSGLALEVLPEYFRSQRQIIIDTERLLADRPRLTQREFRDRSQNIGIDQHLLRLRYGELVGDEEEAGDLVGVDESGAPDVHAHDTEENATLLARTVKATLKAALAEMWDAELRLRTYDPRAALPYEYRALELLKQVQQSARLYVRRTGFEPAPLEPDRNRLTGELEGIASRSRAADRPRVDSLAAVRAGLTALAAIEEGRGSGAAHIGALEGAGREIARLAIADPARHLETLGALRDLIASLEQGTPCAGCLARAARGLWMALPAPAATPSAARGGATGVARAYRELLERLP